MNNTNSSTNNKFPFSLQVLPYLAIAVYLMLPSRSFAQEIKSFKTSDGALLYYSITGTGSTVMMLYGGPGLSAFPMQPWADTLSSEIQCIIFHQRGTGWSENVKIDDTTINLKRAVNDIEDLRIHLGKKKLILCGFSWGGALAQAYAAYYPKRVKNLVLIASLGPDLSLLMSFASNIRSRTGKDVADSLTFWNQHEDSEMAREKRLYYTFIPYFFNQDIGRKLLQKTTLSINYETSLLMWLDLRKNYDLNVELKKYKGKCYIIRPKQDVIPEGMTYQIKKAIPQSEIIFIEDCGHFPDLECPNEFYGILSQTLKK